MRIKTYTATQLGEALSRIKRELGEDAFILSTRQVEIKGKPGTAPVTGYEVVAAGESHERIEKTAVASPRAKVPGMPNRRVTQAYARQGAESSAPPPPARKTPPAVPVETASPAAPEPSPKPEPEAEVTPRAEHGVAAGSLENLQREIRELKRLVRWSAQSVPSARLKIPDPDADALFVEMIANDMDEALARRIVAEAQELVRQNPESCELEQAARRILAGMIQVAPMAEKDARVVAAFIGPTGVGKTTTIAKLASRLALELERRTALITLDTYRIGAAEQLRIYADLIGIPLFVASTNKELERALHECRELDAVLIDTVGRAPGKLEQMEDLSTYLRANREIEKHLVLSLGAKPLDLHETINAFEAFGADKIVFTKLDETLSTGSAANELVRTRKPLSYLTNGQNVPQDLQIPTSSQFAELVVPSDIHQEAKKIYA